MSSPAASSSGTLELELEPDATVSRMESSTPATSPPPNALSEYSPASSVVYEVGALDDVDDAKEEDEDPENVRRLKRLKFLLERSAVYSKILQQRMEEDKANQLEAQSKAARSKASVKKPPRRTKGTKRLRVETDSEDEGKGKRKKGENGQPVCEEDTKPPAFEQPELITGARLKNYQLEGLQWMVSLDKNGISGILADEMGLGKTLQTIAFSAYLREHGNSRPFLVVCPLSVLHNWVDEYKKFAPSIPVCMYHGLPEHRAELRRTVMAIPGAKKANKPNTRAKAKPAKKKAKINTKPKPSSSRQQAESPLRRSSRGRRVSMKLQEQLEDEDDEDDNANDDEYRESQDEDDSMDTQDEDDTMDTEALSPGNDADDADIYSGFPIVLTTYEMIIRDRLQLSRYQWGYIVVDEGHRLKNLNCKLMQEIKKYTSAGRMILTGTPLHNNLAELWSLLNFILPDIFNDVDSFQDWFNLPTIQSSLPSSQSTEIISSLHAILKPFLLRRLKIDVETNLPPKKEYLLYAPLSLRQREAYESILSGNIRGWLMKGGTGNQAVQDALRREEEKERQREQQLKEEDERDANEEEKKGGKRRSRRHREKMDYTIDEDDDEWLERLERGEIDERRRIREQQRAEEEAKIGVNHQVKNKLKQINNMRLQNLIMQLRKVCSHPFLFDWPIDEETWQPVLGEEIINASGKMMVLDRLLKELFARGHKVLLFSQFTTMLDIIEDWATDFMGWTICRIDGSTGALERREQMNRFQTAGDAPDAPRLFLLSTRAGGLGINLVAADTVIFYDQDWNPQMDIQAQDRAHRIGQTKPVLIFRLLSAHTIETKIMQCATAKRKLEALVIAKGKFKAPAGAVSQKKETMAEMAASLLRLEGEKIDVVPNTTEGKRSVLSDEDLEMLLDRSPGVFSERGKGWTSGSGPDGHAAEVNVGKKAAFAVYEAPVEEGNDALATMLGEEIAP